MRILHVYKEFHPQGSGVARHMAGLSRASRALGCQPAIFAPDHDPDAPRACPVDGGGARALWRAVGAADLVHLHGARTVVTALAGLFAHLRGRPFVYTPHCYYRAPGRAKRLAKHLWDHTVERWLVRRAAATILLAPVWVAALAALGLHPRKLAIVPNCVDVAAVTGGARADMPRLPGNPSLLAVGRLDPVKRLDDAIRVLARPALAGAVLHLVGGGGDRPRLEALAEQLGVAARVVWHGRLDDAAVAALRPDLALLPSAEEGGPTVLLESLLRGVPILCGDGPGTRALAEAIGWSALFPPGDLDALAQAIARWRGAVIPVSVTAAITTHYGWAARTPDLVDIYRAAIDLRRSPR